MSIGSFNFKFIKSTDRAWIDNVISFSSKSSSTIGSIQVNPILGGTLNLDKTFGNNQDLEEILKCNSELISSMTIHFVSSDGSFILSLNRSTEQPKDTCTINFNGVTQEKKSFGFKCMGIIRKTFKAVDSSNYLKNVDESLSDYTAQREESLNRLESVTTALITDQEKYRQDLEKQYESRKQNLQKEHESKLESLKSEEERLNQKIKEVDDRASMHARRELHRNFKQIFKDRSENFKISDGTIALRKPIEVFCWVLLLTFGALFILTILTSLKIIGNAQDTDMISLYIKQISLGVLLATTSVFYIRWRNHWFERHAQEEFFLKRFEIDLDRASWAVELASEWIEEKKKEIPESLLNRITTNLFEKTEHEIPKLHPIDDLSSAIFGASSRLNLKLNNGSEIELDRKGINSLKKL